MSSATRRSLLKIASLSAAALAGAGNFLHADQVVGQAQPVTSGPEKQTPANVMSIAAAPGDTFFVMGSPVAMAVETGGKGSLLSLTLGERGSPTIAPAQYGAMQQKSAQGAAALMGAQALFLSYRDGEVPVNDEIKFAVCDLIREYKPQIVVTHWKGSWHKDHRACYEIVQDAIFYAGLPGIVRERSAHDVRTLYFADNWEDAAGFVADTYLEITPVYDRWMKACSLFPMWRGETGFRYNDYYASRAAACGCLSQCSKAVCFMSPADERVRDLRRV